MALKRFLKGLFKDTGYIDQPEGTWRHARNMVINMTDGAISNEGGTEMSGHLGVAPNTGAQNDKVIGAVEVNDDRTILFVTNIADSMSGTGKPPRSEIGLWENGVYYPVFNPTLGTALDPEEYITNDLNFRETNPIEGTFKVDSKGDLIIYWTDDLNPPRAFNIDRQIRESSTLNTIQSLNITLLYGIASSAIDHIDILNLFPYSGPVPHIDVNDQGTHQGCVIEGGGLLTAVYYLALAYVDDDAVATNYLTVSNPISIVDEFDATVPPTKKDGARAGSQTTKAIKWDISNLNDDYRYIRPVIVRSKGDAMEAFKLNDLEFTGTTTSVIFSGLETVATGSVAEVIVDTIAYDTAKTIQQLDNILYLGNTTGSKDLGYQKYANNIKLKSRVEKIEDFDEYIASVDNFETGFGSLPANQYGDDPDNIVDVDPTKSYRYVPNIFKWKGYMRDEVYAFYIAFILRDGSMSYAYHIPGREALGNELDPADTLQGNDYGYLWEDIQKTSPEYSRIFHWVDSSVDSVSGGSHGPSYMDMNYWQNATETYPNTDNFEVWDETGQLVGPSGSIQGLNVRHHHFPSNRYKDRTTILETKDSRTSKSSGSVAPTLPINGNFEYGWNKCARGHGRVFPDDVNNPTKAQFLDFVSGTGNLSTDADASVLWDGEVFTANQAMTVEVRFRLWFERSWSGQSANGTSCEASWAWIDTNALAASSSTGSSTNPTTYSPDTSCCNSCSSVPSADYICSYGSCDTDNAYDVDWCQTDWITYELEAGEKIWLNAASHDKGNGKLARQASPGGSGCGGWGIGSGCTCPPCKHRAEFKVTSSTATVDPKDYHDADIKHQVQRLGFDLEDIKIPRDIADKIQGFRIYYANRKHSDRTVLGQSILLPAPYRRERLGICKEAVSETEAPQVLSTLQDKPEEFYSMDPWAKEYWFYPQLNHQLESYGANDVGAITNDYAMNVFKFHDFYLLRTKNSLASATHIDIQYKVQNFAWNGPDIQQDKKMVTILNDPGTTEPIEVKEKWGWDAKHNCYPKDINSCIHIGHNYGRPPARTLPRLLGQKAKTYLLGDTIFKGGALGFGGKLFNEFGESCIAFKLKDNHAISSYFYRSYPNSNTYGYFADVYGAGAPELEYGHYGGEPFGYSILTNLVDSTGEWKDGGRHGLRSQGAIANLKAFKTGVYKSIDSQELVWTGFEVLGEDLDNYIFEGYSMLSGATGKTIDTHPDGIFGGDTFICRYGLISSIKPSNHSESSSPKKAIHYHIVESTDNINFRHQEDDDSFYFPGGIAKNILRAAGPTDFHHVDNMRYNSNYSENNNIRPAFPLPVKDTIQTDFPTRTHRSAKHDTTSVIDNYRIFLANQYKDLPKNRGDLWKLSSFSNLLYFHMEESLFAAQGKQTMSMGDGSEAFVGSGDIFAQEPNEMIQTEGGFGGTQSQWAALTTRYGYFFVDRSSYKVFLMKDSLNEISNIGMESWFRTNLKFELEQYEFTRKCDLDNPISGMGLHAIYDPKFKRILLTKREFKPTQTFIDGWNKPNGPGSGSCPDYVLGKIRFNSTQCIYQFWGPDKNGNCKWNDIQFHCAGGYFTCHGWTISYYPEIGVWASFHDYIPYIYFNTSINFYSLTEQYNRPVWTMYVTTLAMHEGTTFGNAAIWQHNSENFYGVVYQEWQHYVQNNISEADWLTTLDHKPFEFEFIHNEFKDSDTLLSSFNYTLETFNQADVSVLEHGFTSYFIYNTFQISGENLLEYLVNTRRIGNNWKINKFRDLARLEDQNNILNTPNTSDYYMSTNANIIGGTNTGTITTSSTNTMFTIDGMNKDINLAYLNLTKNWNLQRKFIDKWVGIRLIYNNISNNLLNLYATDVVVRKMYR